MLRAPREILGASEEFFRGLDGAAAGRAHVVVDCSELKRVDFVSAGGLLNAAMRLRERNAKLELRNANALVAALLEVMGVSALATVTARR